jgi:hypothetical protein
LPAAKVSGFINRTRLKSKFTPQTGSSSRSRTSRRAVESSKATGVKFHGGIEDTPLCQMAFGEDTEGNGFILHRRK